LTERRQGAVLCGTWLISHKKVTESKETRKGAGMLREIIMATAGAAVLGSLSLGGITPSGAASTKAATTAPNLYLYTGNGTTRVAMLNAATEKAEGTEPAEVLVPGPAFIKDKYGTKVPLPSPCGYLNDEYPGWQASPSGAGLRCALLQSETTAAEISNVTVIAWLKAAAPNTGSYISQCLQYLTWTLHANNTWTYKFVDLYWDGNTKVLAWKTFNDSIYGAQQEYCSAPVTTALAP
jgi:hypothetical protein